MPRKREQLNEFERREPMNLYLAKSVKRDLELWARSQGRSPSQHVQHLVQQWRRRQRKA